MNQAGYDPLMLDACTWYAERVMSGEIPAGPLVAGQMQRHLNYLERSRDPEDFPFVYMPQLGLIFRRWAAENLRWVKGEVAGQPIQFLPWQAAAFDYFLGYARRFRDAQGAWRPMVRARMVSTVDIFVPKGAGKNQMLNGLLLYVQAVLATHGSDIFLTSPRLGTQSGEQMRFLALMAKQLGFKIERPSSEVTIVTNPLNQVRIRPLSAIGEEGTKDGGRVYAAAFDEVYSIKNGTAFEELTSGGRRSERGSFAVRTGTAAKSPDGWGWEMFNIARDQVDMERWKDPDHKDDPSMFAFMAAASGDEKAVLLECAKPPRRRAWNLPADDPRRIAFAPALKGRAPDEALRHAIMTASPSIKLTPDSPGTILYDEAVADITAHHKGAGAVLEALRTIGNLWPNVDGAWLSMKRWAPLARPERETSGRVTYGVYSASLGQVVALVVIHLDVDPIHVTTRAYAAKGGVAGMARKDRRAEVYDRWIADGDLVIDGTGDAATLDALAADLEQLHRTHRVMAGRYSKAVVEGRMESLLQRYRWQRVTGAAYTHGAYDPGSQELYRRVDAGSLTHDGNAVLTEGIRRMGVKANDKSGQLLPIKGTDTDRIEAALALVLALVAACPYLGQKPAGGTVRKAPPRTSSFRGAIGLPRHSGRPR